jgi:hypothetical protein
MTLETLFSISRHQAYLFRLLLVVSLARAFWKLMNGTAGNFCSLPCSWLHLKADNKGKDIQGPAASSDGPRILRRHLARYPCGFSHFRFKGPRYELKIRECRWLSTFSLVDGARLKSFTESSAHSSSGRPPVVIHGVIAVEHVHSDPL